jgi:SAM-dependent methyltransferase
VSLKDAWEAEAENWVAWARKPGHDSYWRFHRDAFLKLLPPPPRMVLDVGCGEGRLPRDLKAQGYSVVGVDASPSLIRQAREADPDGEYVQADAAQLPFSDQSFELVVAFLSLHDVDDLPAAIGQIGRVLEPGGRLCAAIVHPINSSGAFESKDDDAAFVIQKSYFEDRLYSDAVERDGLKMTFTSRHRPLQAFSDALAAAGLVIERIVELPDTSQPPGSRWRRLPLILQFVALKPGAGTHE